MSSTKLMQTLATHTLASTSRTVANVTRTRSACAVSEYLSQGSRIPLQSSCRWATRWAVTAKLDQNMTERSFPSLRGPPAGRNCGGNGDHSVCKGSCRSKKGDCSMFEAAVLAWDDCGGVDDWLRIKASMLFFPFRSEIRGERIWWGVLDVFRSADPKSPEGNPGS